MDAAVFSFGLRVPGSCFERWLIIIGTGPALRLVTSCR
jgi:hypothetical protein